MYAVIETGGKQFRVEEQDALRVEKLPQAAGEDVVLDRVLLISGEDGLTVGAPYIEGARVSARVIAQGKGAKIHGFTYRRRKRTRRRFGHRQPYTEIRIESIQA